MNTSDVIDYIYSNNNKDELFEMDKEDLKSLIFNICDTLSSEYEYSVFGTYGEHYECDVDSYVVLKHVMEDREKWLKEQNL